MVKKLGVFITILGLFFVGIPQYNSNAAIINGVDYRFLETTEEPTIQGSQVFYTIVVNELYGGATIKSIHDYMSLNNIYRINMEAGALFNLYYSENFETLIDLVDLDLSALSYIYDSGRAYFALIGYNIQGQEIFEMLLATSETNFVMPETSRFYSNVMFADIQASYNTGYNQARAEYGIYFNNDWRSAEWYGNYEYERALIDSDATGFVGLLTAVFGGLGSLLAIELLPNIYIGSIIAVPLVFGIIFFILGKRKGD